ncbi:MAG: DinB family protein [Gemmatimonadales bacterium]
MFKPFAAVALAAALATPAAAQAHHDNGPLADLVPLQKMYFGWAIQAAEQMDEADYGFKPTPDVRSFGQLAGHMANANFAFCATAKGEKSPATANYEKVTTKAEIVAGMKAAEKYCLSAYEGLSHERAETTVDLFGQKGTVNWVLAWNAVHNGEHYGNMVTYFRLKGKVPPSSQGSN